MIDFLSFNDCLNKDIYVLYTEDEENYTKIIGVYDDFGKMEKDMKKYVIKMINNSTIYDYAEINHCGEYILYSTRNNDIFETIKYNIFKMNISNESILKDN